MVGRQTGQRLWEVDGPTFPLSQGVAYSMTRLTSATEVSWVLTSFSVTPASV